MDAQTEADSEVKNRRSFGLPVIEKEIAKKQLSRISRMRKFPESREAIADLLGAIQLANSEAIAEQCISNFLDLATSETYCPMPAEIRRWIYEHQEAEDTERKQRIAGCRECGGTGWRLEYHGMYQGVRECRCRKESAA